jgi:hypothetical protein
MTKESAYHEQLLVVGGLSGGIAFTGLVLVLSLPSSFDVAVFYLPSWMYYQTLVGALAVTSGLFVLGSLALSPVAAGSSSARSEREDFGTKCYSAGFILVLIDLPLLLVPLAPIAAVVVSLVEIVLFVRLLTAKQN